MARSTSLSTTWLVWPLVSVCACQWLQPAHLPTAQVRPVDGAHAVPAQLCADTTPEDRAAVVNRLPRPLAVETVARNLSAGKLTPHAVATAVSIVLPAPPTMTAAELQRVLTCHAADVALGKVPMLPDDPFSDARTWLVMHTTVEGRALVVHIEPTDVAQIPHVLERADRWGRFPVEN